MSEREELFPPITRQPVYSRDLRLAALVCDALGEQQLAVLGYPGEGPWFSFDVGERRFAIWRETGKLYECDSYGAAGDDPIEVDDLKEEPTQ